MIFGTVMLDSYFFNPPSFSVYEAGPLVEIACTNYSTISSHPGKFYSASFPPESSMFFYLSPYLLAFGFGYTLIPKLASFLGASRFANPQDFINYYKYKTNFQSITIDNKEEKSLPPPSLTQIKSLLFKENNSTELMKREKEVNKKKESCCDKLSRFISAPSCSLL